MKTFAIFFFVFLFSLKTYSLNWTWTFGGSGSEEGLCVIEDQEDNYVVCGWTNSFGAGGSDVYVLKVDSMGDTVWTRTYGGTGDDSGEEIFQTSDGGYLIAGNSNSFSAGGLNEIYVLRLDNDGDTLWTGTYGDSVNIYMTASEILSDEGLVVSTLNIDSSGYPHVNLFKINDEGNLLWRKNLITSVYFDEIRDIDQMNNGNLVFAQDPFCIFSTDTSGDIMWIAEFDSIYLFCCNNTSSVERTADDKYIFISHFDDPLCGYQYKIFKSDSLGNIIWSSFNNIEREYFFHEHIASDVKNISINQYVICGYHIEIGGVEEGLLQSFRDEGNHFTTIFYNDDSFADKKFISFFPLSSNGFIITGAMARPYGQPSDLILVKTDSMGVFVEELPIPKPPSVISISVSNINNRYLFAITLQENTDLILSIYDVLGRLVLVPINSRLSMGIHEIPFTSEITGIYFFRLESDGFTQTGKFTVLR